MNIYFCFKKREEKKKGKNVCWRGGFNGTFQKQICHPLAKLGYQSTKTVGL